jgi:hypothetical protein
MAIINLPSSPYKKNICFFIIHLGFCVVGLLVGVVGSMRLDEPGVGFPPFGFWVGGMGLEVGANEIEGCSEGALDGCTGQALSLLIFTLSLRYKPILVSRMPKSPTTISQIRSTSGLQTENVTDEISSPLLPIPSVPTL